jgi:hypothetical protein
MVLVKIIFGAKNHFGEWFLPWRPNEMKMLVKAAFGGRLHVQYGYDSVYESPYNLLTIWIGIRFFIRIQLQPSVYIFQ